jgi:two-component system cell cycle response regulator DivK
MARILIFDDDTDILELCSVLLKNNGFTVFTRTNCINAPLVVAEVKPDVILMDNWMPEITGSEAIRILKSTPSLKDIPIIFFSAINQAELVAKDSGADYYLQKPFDLDTFYDVVSKAVERSNSRKCERENRPLV